MYVPDEELLNDVPGILTELIATLSETPTVKITVWLWLEVVSETEVSLAEKVLITGSWSSCFVIPTVILWVELLPAASLTVSVGTSVWDPYE